MTQIETAIDRIYETFDGPSVANAYHDRVGTQTLGVLTVTTEQEARELVLGFAAEIAGKTVVEIGAGVGFLALEMARHAKQVWAIECDVGWSWAFTKFLYAVKPPNLTWIFGNAEAVAPWLRADVCVLRTRSGVTRLVALAGEMAPRIVLSIRDEPMIGHRGDFGRVAEYIDRRVEELYAEAQAMGVT